ncbi:MAG: hypothetical protein JST92_26830 [Deltaproteobacteria bacterium]|nr:hypothetical protein [Deltaproteobacteria bacterium]
MTKPESHQNHRSGAFESVPTWARRPFAICKYRLDDEMKFLHLALRGLSLLTSMPELIQVLNSTNVAALDAEQAQREERRLSQAKLDATWVTQEAQRGNPILHAHSVVGIWSAIEVLSEDFSIAWLTNVPSAWNASELSKLKLPIGQYHQSSDDERSRWVVAELARSQGADFRRGVAKLSSVLEVFGLSPSIGANVRRALHEMCEVRNVLVHCGGRADARLLKECPWMELKIGEPVQIAHSVYGWYLHAARTFSERVFNQLLVALTLPSCHCAGVDEISPRPERDPTKVPDPAEQKEAIH